MEQKNLYSLSLTRYCFLHRDYLRWYTANLPRRIFETVANETNCEDIAMSFMISALTEGQPPLLADLWAIKTMVKLYTHKKISGSKQHKAVRDACSNTFADILGLKRDEKHNHGAGCLQLARYRHEQNSMFDCGASEDNRSISYNPDRQSLRQTALERKVNWWRTSDGSKTMIDDLRHMMSTAAAEAFQVRSRFCANDGKNYNLMIYFASHFRLA